MRARSKSTEAERPGNRMPKRNDPEFAPIKGRTTAKDAERVQKIDNRNDKKLAKRYGVRFKG